MPVIEYDPRRNGTIEQTVFAVNPRVIGGVTFMPGTENRPGYNQIPDDVWNQLLNGEYGDQIKKLLNLRILQVIQPSGTIEGAVEGGSITGFSFEQAIDMIKNCTSLETLNQWKEESIEAPDTPTNRRLKAAIDKQIELFIPTKDTRAKDGKKIAKTATATA